MEDFSYVSQMADGIDLSILDLHCALKDLEKGLSQKETQLLELGNAYARFPALHRVFHHSE